MKNWLIYENSLGESCNVFCKAENGMFSMSSDENEETIFKTINFSNIFNVVLTSKTSFTIICVPDESLTFKTETVEIAQKWICALLEDDSENSNKQIGLDSFKFIREIGSGTHGRIYLAKHIETGKFYAIKSIPKTENSNQVFAERNTLMIMNNPFIVKLFYAFQTAHYFYFVLEFVEGGDLSQYFERENKNEKSSKITEKEAKQIIAEIAIALESLHTKGIVFRDLKPQNVLVKKNGHIKIADFGLARDILHDKTSRTICGTLSYIAPEMITKENYSFEVDWWSLGVISYQLFFDKLPFNGNNQKELFESIINHKLEIPEECDNPLLSSFLNNLLEKDPSKRLNNIFSHPFMADIKKEEIIQMKNDIHLRYTRQSIVTNDEEPIYLLELEKSSSASKISQDFIIPNFSYSSDDLLIGTYKTRENVTKLTAE